MALTISLKELPVAPGTEVPGTLDAWLVFFRQHMGFDGFELFNGINFGPATPSPDDRDKPWFKKEINGTPVGWFCWDGAEWVPIPFVVPNGITSDRPVNPVVGQKYFDTTINAELTFERGAWRTTSGSPGDIKFVDAASLVVAIQRNPGWVQATEINGRVIGAVGAADGLTTREFDDTVGVEKIALAEENLPAHAHTISGLVAERLSRNNLSIGVWNNGGGGEGALGKSTDSTGDGEQFDIMNPTIYRWCLKKQ